jgi:membrane fusion protein (multidrug efflux system)
VAQAAVEEAESQLAIARTNLSYCTVTSPITGIVKENGFKVGALANVTDKLCTVSDDSEVQAWFSYTESQLLEAINLYDLRLSPDGKRVGSSLPPVKLQLKNGVLYDHEGMVTEVGGIIDRNTGTVICKATFPNPDYELRSGLSATLIFPTTLGKVLCVPQTAAVRLQNQLMFYRVKKDGTVEGVICKAIPSNDGKEYYISKGLKPGDEVVTNGVHRLSKGEKVK